ncbi:MAG: Aspartate ammonia-lyase, partial [Myxococcaceae bacterium]|nr:Aspartate ammonia-lyase [Myxococcaceae bacterium]
MKVTSQLEAVTVYASGAVCTRRAKLDPPAQPTRQLRITGLPLSLRSTSLRARVLSGPAELRVLDVRAGFDVQLAEEIDVPAEQKALESAQAELGRLEQALARLVKESQELAALRPAFPPVKKGEPPRSAPVEAMLQLADFVDRQLATRNGRRQALEQQVADARNELQLRQRRLAEASSSKRTERSQLSRSAVVMLSAEQTQPLELAIEYQVPGARWAPNYELRLDPAMNGGSLKMRASVAQHSGEDWSNVALSLSTAQLDRRTDLPELRAQKIGRSQPPPPRTGWREPPPGLDELFEGYDQAVSGSPPRNAPSSSAEAAAP